MGAEKAKGVRESCLDGILLEITLEGRVNEDDRRGYSEKKSLVQQCAGKCSKISFLEKEISDLWVPPPPITMM